MSDVKAHLIKPGTIFSLTAPFRWISDWFKKADKNKDGRMNFKEVQDLLKMMNVDMNEHHAHRLFTVQHRFLNASQQALLYFLASTDLSLSVSPLFSDGR